MGGFMDKIKRSEMKMGYQEVLTSFEWELKFVTKPAAVYYPGDDIIAVRLKDVNLSAPSQNELMNIAMRGGHTLKQAGLTSNTGTCELVFQDFEDQAVTAFIEDWITKMNSRDTRRGAHKRDLYADITLTRLNSFRKSVKEWVMEGCLPDSGNYGDQFSSEKSPLGNVTLSLAVEWFTTKLLNT